MPSFRLNLSYDGGGGFIDLSSKCPPPISICENNRKSYKIMHCVEKKKILIDSFKDTAIFHVILEIDKGCPKKNQTVDIFLNNFHVS